MRFYKNKDDKGTYYKLGENKHYYIKGNSENKKIAIHNTKHYILQLIFQKFI